MIAIKNQINLLLLDKKEVSRLGEGKSFGEAALLNKKNQRLATIKCITDCYFGTLTRPSFLATVAKI